MAKETIFRIEQGTVRKLRSLTGYDSGATSMGYKVYLRDGKPYLQADYDPAMWNYAAKEKDRLIELLLKAEERETLRAISRNIVSRPYELSSGELEEIRRAANILFSTFPIANATLGLALHLYELSAKKATESLIEQISTDRKSA